MLKKKKKVFTIYHRFYYISRSLSRFLEDRLYKFLSANLTLDWVDNLGSVVSGINNTPRDILYGLSSIQAQSPENVEILKKKFALKRYKYREKYENRPLNLKEGDRVKVYKKPKTFSKGYEQHTESKPDFVEKILDTYPKQIILKNHKNKKFYRQELVRFPISDTTHYPISDYFIAEEKNEPKSTLRSGVSLNSEKIFRIQSRKSDFLKWIDDTEWQKLVKNGILPSSDK